MEPCGGDGLSEPTFSLVPIPKWVIIDNNGLTAGGATMATLSNLDPTQEKPVFRDPAGVQEWPNPIIFDANGTAGPFYWEFDEDVPEDTYFLDVRNADGTPLFTVVNFFPPAAGSGGVITNAASINNYIVNSPFFRNGGTSISLSTLTTLAPGAHEGITQSFDSGPANKFSAPDICFITNINDATHSISFDELTPGQLDPDYTPEFFLKYQCTVVGTETFRVISIPITKGVQNFSDTIVSLKLWLRADAIEQVTLQWYQFFGDGTTASVPVITPIDVINLSPSLAFAPFSFEDTVPSIGGKILGECGNDALFLQIVLPAGNDGVCNIDIAKPSMYLGNIIPSQDFQSLDQVTPIIAAPRTGDIRTSLNTFAPFGWVPMNDGSIGSATSGATCRANVDTFPLYKLIFDSCSDALAPVIGGRVGDAITNFQANKPLTLTKMVGRVMAGVPVWISAPPVNINSISRTFTANPADERLTLSTTLNLFTGVPCRVDNSGGALPAPLLEDVTYYMILVSSTEIQLAFTPDEAIAGTAINLTSAGSGTNTLLVAASLSEHELGAYEGLETHTLSSQELPDPITQGAGIFAAGAGGTNVIKSDIAVGSGIISNDGGDQPHNIMQLTAYYNVFAKL